MTAEGGRDDEKRSQPTAHVGGRSVSESTALDDDSAARGRPTSDTRSGGVAAAAALAADSTNDAAAAASEAAERRREGGSGEVARSSPRGNGAPSPPHGSGASRGSEAAATSRGRARRVATLGGGGGGFWAATGPAGGSGRDRSDNKADDAATRRGVGMCRCGRGDGGGEAAGDAGVTPVSGEADELASLQQVSGGDESRRARLRTSLPAACPSRWA